MISATQVTIGGHTVAVGLEWRALPGISSQPKEIAQISSELGMRHGVVVSSEDSTLVGLSHINSKIPSGAAWVAAGSKGESIVLLEPISETHCWVCAVRNGCPQPEFDRILPIEEIGEALQRLSSISLFKVATKHFDGADLDIDFHGIIEGKKPSNIKQLVGIPKAVKLSLAGAVAVSLAAFGWYNYAQQQAQLAAQAQLDELQNQSVQEQKLSAEAQRQVAIKQVEEIVRTKVTSAASVFDAVTAWMGAIDSMPTITGGWKLKAIECTTSECKVVWLRTKTGTTDAFLAVAATNGWKVASYDLNGAAITLPVSIPARNGDPHAIPPESEVHPALYTALQSLALMGIEGTTKDPIAPVVTLPAGPTAPPSSTGAPAAPADFISPWKTGAFTVSGKRFFEARGIPEYLQSDHISIEKFKLNAETSAWTMEGLYAVK